MHPDTGEWIPERKAPYIAQSNRPGIGYDWYQKYKSDVFPHGYVVVDGIKKPVPEYYLTLLRRENLPMWLSVMKARKEHVEAQPKKPHSERQRQRQINREIRENKTQFFGNDRKQAKL